MRVIAGRLRGAVLEAPPGRVTRPITDRVKEALFSVLGHRLGTAGALPDIAVLDLFAGSGALGIESLSRGARWCLFVERDRRAVRALRANLQKLRLLPLATVAVGNAWTMRIPPAPGEGYGLVFIDPPYAESGDRSRLAVLLERLVPRLAAGSLVVFRCPATVSIAPEALWPLCRVDERVYGGMRIVLLGAGGD